MVYKYLLLSFLTGSSNPPDLAQAGKIKLLCIEYMQHVM